MLDLSKYQSIGEALRDALIQYSNEVCLIEADREREKRNALTYRDFQGNARIPAFEKLCRMAAFLRRRSRQHHHGRISRSG